MLSIHDGEPPRSCCSFFHRRSHNPKSKSQPFHSFSPLTSLPFKDLHFNPFHYFSHLTTCFTVCALAITSTALGSTSSAHTSRFVRFNSMSRKETGIRRLRIWHIHVYIAMYMICVFPGVIRRPTVLLLLLYIPIVTNL